MLRTVRKITPLVRALVFGVAGVTSVAATTTVLAGCEDENKPEYFIKRLDDPATRAMSVKRLGQFFDDAMTKAEKNRDKPEVKELLDKIIPPLTKTYMAGNLDDRTRFEILRLLADSRDPRAKQALVKSLQDFQPNSSEEEARNSARALARSGVRDQDAMDAIINVFLKLQAGSEKGGLVWKDYMEAMIEISSPSWEPQLLERLNRPMEMIGEKDKDDKGKITAYRNEQFWQNTAAQILGNIKSAKAVKPLFKVVISPKKADVSATAIIAIVKMGKDTVPVLTEIIAGRDNEVNEFAKKEVAQGPEVAVLRTAALVTGTVGRVESVKPMLDALAASKDNTTKAIIARELAKLPGNAETLKAYLDVLLKMPLDVDLPTGETAAVILTEQVTMFYDSSVIDTLIKRADEAKGNDEDKTRIRDTTMVTIIDLMKKDQIETVEKAINKWAPKAEENKPEKDAFAKSKEVVLACGDKLDCYLAKIEEPGLQEKGHEAPAIKAAYMLGMLGNEATRTEIVKRLPRIKNPAIKFALAKVIDKLTPTGDKATVDAIQKLIDDNKAKGDQNVILGDNPLRQVMYRLAARL